MAERARCEICNRDFPSEDALKMHNSAKHPIQEQSKKSKKLPFLILLILIAVMGGYFLINGNLTGNAVNTENSVQKINLGFNGNYYPNTIQVKANQPVEITLDNTVKGCFRSFNIDELGVSYRSSSPSDTIKFTPSKKGKFRYACGMNMGYGTIIVE